MEKVLENDQEDNRKNVSDSEEQSAITTAANEFLNYIQVEKGLSRNTISAYRRALLRYIEFLSENDVTNPNQITRSNLVEFASSLQQADPQGLSPRSVAQIFSAVRMFHKFMVLESYADDDPSVALATPKLPGRLPRALTREQVEKLLNAPAGGDVRGMRDLLILDLLYATGMRISELVGLDVGDLDVSERLLTCRGKGGKWRLLPYGVPTAQTIVTYLEDVRPKIVKGKRTSALVVNMRGGRLTRQGCWKIVKGYARDEGLDKLVTPHVLRHTFATHLLEGGASILVVQELLGHVSVSTTQIYTKVTRDHLVQVYRDCHPRA